jgi:hypothetical protein
MSPAARWRPSSVHGVKQALSKFLTVLHEDRIDLTSAGLADLVTKPNLRRLVQHMVANGLSPNSQRAYLSGLWLAACALAPETDWSWLRRGINQMRQLAGQRVSADDAVTTDQLLLLGKRRFAEAWDEGAAHKRPEAVRARDGLIIALLALRPLRRANFAALRLGEHVHVEGDRVRISIPATQMKMGKRGYEAD